MKRELKIHLLAFASAFLIITLIKFLGLGPKLLIFWLGGVLGTFLLDLDHLIYVFYLRPHEVTSQRFLSFIKQGKYWAGVAFLAETHRERIELIGHTVSFQIILTVLAFWAVVSSNSLLGNGVVLGIFIHILVDQFLDFKDIGDLRNWFWQFKSVPGKDFQKLYFAGFCLIFLLFALVLV